MPMIKYRCGIKNGNRFQNQREDGNEVRLKQAMDGSDGQKWQYFPVSKFMLS
jgi:hypothetical protein